MRSSDGRGRDTEMAMKTCQNRHASEQSLYIAMYITDGEVRYTFISVPTYVETGES
jgi:hypothetical protein